jgi:hypothetical protein
MILNKSSVVSTQKMRDCGLARGHIDQFVTLRLPDDCQRRNTATIVAAECGVCTAVSASHGGTRSAEGQFSRQARAHSRRCRSASAVEEISADVGPDSGTAAGKVLSYLDNGGNPHQLIDAARLFVFLKGDNAHDYKFSSAVLEDYYHVSPAWRNRYLAASVFNLRGSKQPDNRLVQRTRAALRA